MRSRMLRIAALAVCLVAPLGRGATANAATTATVSVTGNVVDIAMSLTLDRSSFAFGEIDATGSSYDPASSLATPFSTVGNALGVTQGTAWFADTPLVATITSPVTTDLWVCVATNTNVVDGAGSRMMMAPFLPEATVASAATMVQGTTVAACGVGALGYYVPPGVAQARDFYPGYLVRSTDTPATFSATITFSLGAL